MDVRLIMRPETIAVRKGASTTGVICLRFDDGYFPDEHWDDLVESVMGAWVQSLLLLRTRGRREERIHFMDGPYAVRVSVSEPGVFEFRAMQGDRWQYQAAGGTAAMGPFVADFIRQGREVMRVCDERAGRRSTGDFFKELASEYGV